MQSRGRSAVRFSPSLHVAAGGRLEGEPPAAAGHAVEARLTAEDPSLGFAPTPGRLDLLHLPTGPGLRFDPASPKAI